MELVKFLAHELMESFEFRQIACQIVSITPILAKNDSNILDDHRKSIVAATGRQIYNSQKERP